MNKRYIKICEKLGWKVTEYKNRSDETDITVELQKYSPAGEDFIFTVNKKDFVENVKEYAAHFDVDEHIEMWAEAKIHNTTSGIPSIRRLAVDAEEIDEMLQELAVALFEEDCKNG